MSKRRDKNVDTLKGFTREQITEMYETGVITRNEARQAIGLDSPDTGASTDLEIQDVGHQHVWYQVRGDHGLKVTTEVFDDKDKAQTWTNAFKRKHPHMGFHVTEITEETVYAV